MAKEFSAMAHRNIPEEPTSITAGSVTVNVLGDAAEAGRAASAAVIAEALRARSQGKKVALWLMAAPSAFEFYRAFTESAEGDNEVADLAKTATYYQFDDYPISRESDRFPVTFRSLLENRFVAPVRRAAGGIGTFNYLELTGDEKRDNTVMGEYRDLLLHSLRDPSTEVIQVKGIGMDGHWAFHGAETPLNTQAGIIRVPMGEANRHQQMNDWPQYFRRLEDIPTHAVTCTVALLLMADVIIDIAPQAEKAYSVLACYGTDEILPALPSSALKNHPRASAFVTRDSASALVQLRALREADPDARLPASTVESLKALWLDPDEPGQSERNVASMMQVLAELRLV